MKIKRNLRKIWDKRNVIFDRHFQFFNDIKVTIADVSRSAKHLYSATLMQDRVRRLRQAIARFERLLRDCDDTAVAKTYRAEIAAARTMLDEIEHNRRGQ